MGKFHSAHVQRAPASAGRVADPTKGRDPAPRRPKAQRPPKSAAPKPKLDKEAHKRMEWMQIKASFWNPAAREAAWKKLYPKAAPPTD